MINASFSLERVSPSDFIILIKNFVERSHYILEEHSNEVEHIFTICERKPDSPSFSIWTQTVMGGFMVSDRIRLTVKLKQIGDGLEAEVTGDVLFNDLELINDRPKRKDVMRLEIAMKKLTESLSSTS